VRICQIFWKLAGLVIHSLKQIFLSPDSWSTVWTESIFVVHTPKQIFKSQYSSSTIQNESTDLRDKWFPYSIPATLLKAHAHREGGDLKIKEIKPKCSAFGGKGSTAQKSSAWKIFVHLLQIWSSFTFLSTAQKWNVVHVRHTFVCRAVDIFSVKEMTFSKKVSSNRDSSKWISSSCLWLVFGFISFFCHRCFLMSLPTRWALCPLLLMHCHHWQQLNKIWAMKVPEYALEFWYEQGKTNLIRFNKFRKFVILNIIFNRKLFIIWCLI
jgi:hypothetical protein